MSEKLKLFAGVLALQVMISLYVFTKSDDTGAFKKTEKLLTLDFDKINRMSFEDGEKKIVEIKKRDASWILPAKYSFAASSKKVADFMDRLKNFQKSWPVGKTDISAKQFEVVDEKFERRIGLYNDSKLLAKIYIGTSPSFKKIHARVEGDKNIYSLDYSAYELSVDLTEWMDRKFLGRSKEDIQSIEIEKMTFVNADGDLKVKDLRPTEEMIVSKMQPLLTTVLNPEIQDVIGVDQKYPAAQLVYSYQIETKKKDVIRYNIYRPTEVNEKAVDGAKTKKNDKQKNKSGNGKDSPTKQEPEYLILQTSNHPFSFKLDKDFLKNLADLRRENLVKIKQIKGQNNSTQKTSEKETHANAKDGTKLDIKKSAVAEKRFGNAEKTKKN